MFSNLAEFMLITSGEDRSDAAAFFHRKALRLLTALLAYFHDLGRDRNIPAAAYRCLARPPDVIRAESVEAADEYRKGGSDDDYISVGLAEMAHTEDRQFSSIVATVVNGLEWAGKKTTRGFVESGELPGTKLVQRVLDPKTDIYIRIPTDFNQGSPDIARVLIGSLVRAIRTAVHGEADADLAHRLFIIDEARALRRMDYLVSMRDEARAYGIHLMQIFQSYQQLVECYGPHGAGAWENSVDAVVIGPVQNAVQAQVLSRMIGRRTVETASSSRQRSSQIFMPFSGSAGSSVSNQLRETELIQPSELRKLPPESAVILTTGTAPILASKAIWFTRSFGGAGRMRFRGAYRNRKFGKGDPGQRRPPEGGTDGNAAPKGRGESSEAVGQAGQRDKSANQRPTGAGGKPAPKALVIGNQDGSALACDLPDDLGSIEEDMARLLPGPKRKPKRKQKQKAFTDPQPDHTGVDVKAQDREAAAVNSGAASSAHQTIREDGNCSDSRGTALVPASNDCAGTGRTSACSTSATPRNQDVRLAERTENGRLVSSGTGSIAALSGRGRLWRCLRRIIRSRARWLSVLGLRGTGQDSRGLLTTDRWLGDGWGPGAERECAGSAWGPDVYGGEFDHAGNAHEREARSPDVPGDLRDGDRDDSDLRGLGAAIHRNVVHDSLIERSVAPDANTNEIAKRVLSEPFLRQPQGTSVGIVLPNALGPGIDYPDYLSIVFIPDDRSSPIHLILVDERGKIAGTAGPYRRVS